MIVLLLNFFILNLNYVENSYRNNQNGDQTNDLLDKNLMSQDLAFDNNNVSYSGIGDAWNITHYANRTDKDLLVSFTNNSYDDTEGVALYTDWEGYNLKASIYDLYDTKNWNNGTFNFGNDNGYNVNENDSDNSIISNNRFQNWTFHDVDSGGNNDMSGNYLNSSSTSPDSGGHDCLELRMDGLLSGSYRCYNNRDKCMWNSSFRINRGTVIDSELQFDVNPYYLTDFNSWELTFSLNHKKIYTIGIYTLKQFGEATWHTFKIPQVVWTNTSNIYTSPANNSIMNLSVALEYNSATACYSTGFPNIDRQQLFIDNVKLITKAEVYPSQIQLKINQTADIKDIDWGKGTIELESGDFGGNWLGDKVYVNFSSNHIWNLSGFTSNYFDVSAFSTYKIDLKTDLNLFAIKNDPDSNWKEDTNSLGTTFSVSNNSIVNWVTFAFVNIPSDYKEPNMTVEFPEDITITGVFDPENNNVVDQCDISTPGYLNVPVSILSSATPTFWRFEGISPNYCKELTIYNNNTGIWLPNSTFLSGDYINISVNIKNDPLISEYINKTQAQLYIKFPNGTFWTAESEKLVSPDDNGNVYFDSFKIPVLPPDYEAGEYEVIVTWNNSYSNFGLNETGVIYKKFTVIHDSDLIPDLGIYYIEDVIDDSIVNLYVIFRDRIDNTPIIDANVYAENTSVGIQDFKENLTLVSEAGIYFLEFNASKAKAGNNTLTIYAQSPFYVNNQINITIDVIKETILTVDNDFLTDIPYKQNFTVQFNYTEKNTGNGINTNPTTDWPDGFYYIEQTFLGQYNITCNTSAFESGTLQKFSIFLDEYKYESQSIQIRVQITELATNVIVFVNSTEIGGGEVAVPFQIFEKINITVKYMDIFGNHLTGADVEIIGRDTLDENITLKQYNIILNAEDLEEGITPITIYANKSFYNPVIFQFFIEVTKRQTQIEIWLNNVNETYDPSIELPIGSLLNITVKYTDINGFHINGSIVQIGIDFTGNLTEDTILKQYSIIINTGLFDTGFKKLSLSAEKTNYERIDLDIRLQIRRIRTEIDTEDGEDKITIKPGESITIKIELKDLDFGGYIKDADVTYEWKHGDGDLDEKDDGIYEFTLEDVPEGTYTIEISAFKEGGRYDFDDFEITLTVVRPEGETLLFQILLIIAIIISVGLASYLIAYQRVLKYPKPVRKVRKYRRTLKKKKTPSVDITGREKAIKILFASELDKSGSLLKGKTSVEIASTDKMVKKSLKLSSDKIIEKSEKKSIGKKVDKSPNDVKK
jgi:hypothetical protein